MRDPAAAQRGLTLSFYRHADGSDYTLGGISARFTDCVLVGIVDYSHTVKRGALGTSWDEPVIRPVDTYARVSTPGPDRPPVWLVIDKHGIGDRYLIPGDPDTGQPDLRWWIAGGNYAATTDGRFTELTGVRSAIRVHDRHESSPTPSGLTPPPSLRPPRG